MPIKIGKMKISKNKKMRFFLMSQGSFNQKIRFLSQKVYPVARSHAHTDRVTTEGTLSGFQDFFLQPIIKDLYGTISCSHKTNVSGLANSCVENDVMIAQNSPQIHKLDEIQIGQMSKSQMWK